MYVKVIFYLLIVSLVNYLVITTVVDVILMGALSIRFSRKCDKNKFLITKENHIDIQTGYQCSAFSSAYLLRHWDIEAEGNLIYTTITNKMKDGYVYPKGICNLFRSYGFRVKYCTGNLNALRNEVSKGNPVIVMIKTHTDKNWLHFVPIVGYDENYIFIAESLEELINCNEKYYNRKVKNSEFIKLWDTNAIKMPFYKNTFMSIMKL